MAVVSVLLPVYNQRDAVQVAVASILEQSVRDLEVVVVDDGSEDGTSEVLDRMSGTDRRIRWIRTSHGGIVAALNRGLDACSCPLIARMDADDVAAPDRLLAQIEFLECHPEAGAVGGRVRWGWLEAAGGKAGDARAGEGNAVKGAGQGMRRYIDWLNGLEGWPAIRRSLLEESPLVHPAVTFRRQAVIEAGGYLDDPGPEDWDLWLRMVRVGWVLESLPQDVLIWNDGPHRLTRTHGRYSLDAQMALRVRHLDWLVPEASRCGVNVWSAGQTGRRLMRHLRKADVPIHVILDVDPRRFGQRLHGAEIRPFHELLLHRQRPTLVALGTRDAKTKVRDWCAQHGLVEGEEIWFLS